jgi:hypothetical protein
MTTKSETVLTALFTALSGMTGPTVLRNADYPEKTNASGLVILRDGEPGEPEVTLSPLSYDYEHVALIEVMVQSDDNDANFDVVKTKIGLAIAADRTLGGLCDWVEAEAPVTDDLAVYATTSIKAVAIPVRLFYSTSDPLA